MPIQLYWWVLLKPCILDRGTINFTDKYTAIVNVTHIDAYIQTFSSVDDQKQNKAANCHQAGALTMVSFIF